MSIKLAVRFAGIHNPLILRKGMDGMVFALRIGHAGFQGLSIGQTMDTTSGRFRIYWATRICAQQ